MRFIHYLLLILCCVIINSSHLAANNYIIEAEFPDNPDCNKYVKKELPRKNISSVNNSFTIEIPKNPTLIKKGISFNADLKKFIWTISKPELEKILRATPKEQPQSQPRTNSMEIELQEVSLEDDFLLPQFSLKRPLDSDRINDYYHEYEFIITNKNTKEESCSLIKAILSRAFLITDNLPSCSESGNTNTTQVEQIYPVIPSCGGCTFL